MTQFDFYVKLLLMLLNEW